MKIDTALTRRLRNSLMQAGLEETSDASRVSETPRELTVAQQATLERVLPMLETLYLIMVADLETSDAERATLRGAIKTLTSATLGDDVLDDLLDGFEERLAEQGREARLHQIGALLCADPADAEIAFSLAAAVALADDRVDSEERRLVEDMAESFGISSKRAASILEDATEA